jgi:hypothetical protein
MGLHKMGGKKDFIAPWAMSMLPVNTSRIIYSQYKEMCEKYMRD